MTRRTLAFAAVLAFAAELLAGCGTHGAGGTAGVTPVPPIAPVADAASTTTPGAAPGTATTTPDTLTTPPAPTASAPSDSVPAAGVGAAPVTTIPDPILIDVPMDVEGSRRMVDAYGWWAGAFRRAEAARDPDYPELAIAAAPAMARVSRNAIRARLADGAYATVPPDSINAVRVIRLERVKPDLVYMELCETDDTRYADQPSDPPAIRHSRVEAEVTWIRGTWWLSAREERIDETCRT